LMIKQKHFDVTSPLAEESSVLAKGRAFTVLCVILTRPDQVERRLLSS
jgi:hypothetical protein